MFDLISDFGNDLMISAPLATMSDEEVGETIGQMRISKKLVEATSAGFRDRSKRRLSLPLSSLPRDSRKSSIVSQSSSGKLESIYELGFLIRSIS